MKFRVQQEALADAVAWVARALPARPVVPVLSGLRLEAGDGLSLSCFDYELSASAWLEAEVTEAGAALVPGRLLAEIVRSLPGQPTEFSSDGDAVNLACGSAEFTLVSLPLPEYPEPPPAPPLAGTLDGGDLAGAIAQVLPAASRDDTLPMLTAVCLDIAGDVMTLAATDRYRMAVRQVRWRPARPGLRAVALVPARTLADAARSMAAGEAVSVSFDTGAAGPGHGGEQAGKRGGAGPRPAEGMISFDSGGRRLAGRLMGGEFIRYESRFPAGFDCRAEIPAASFTEAVKRVSLVADRASPVRLTFAPGRVAIEAQTEGRARATETVTASFHGSEPSIAFNPHYLLDGLTAAAAGTHRAHPPREAAAPGRDGAGGQDSTGGRDGTGVPAGGAPAGAVGPAASAPTYIRLEFSTPAKPALITPAGGDGDEGERTGEGTAGSGQDGKGPAAFRYLVVPLRPPTPT